MTDTKNHTAGAAGSLEGRVFHARSTAEVREAIELAFDYRGDITISLTGGDSVVGYLFNRQAAEPDPYIEIFPSHHPSPRRISYSTIAAIAFTGEDTADGRSWENWIAKKESERRAESERIEEQARVRGLL